MLKLFDFECKKCKKVEERLISNKKDVVLCAKCGSVMTILPSAPPFHLKGSGWAKDNYGSKTETKKKGKSSD